MVYLDHEKIKKMDGDYIINTYGRNPEKTPLFVKGKGCILYDENGDQYLDLLSGIGVNNLGHGYPAVVEKVKAQLDKLIHTSNLYYTLPQVELARQLVENSFADKVFFGNSGAEANEAAIKLARKYSEEKYGETRKDIITAVKSFHGRTIATLTATGQEKVQYGFGPLPQGFKYVPLNHIEAFKEAVDDNTCAVMLEPVIGEGGIYPCEKDYLEEIRDICTREDILLIYDEIQSGMGRTARLFAHEHYGVMPDIMTLAKALGGGIPIGAMLSIDKAAAVFTPGSHASTFGGNPVAAAAAGAVMNTLLEEGFLSEVEKKSEYFAAGLGELATKFSSITGVRNLGMMMALQVEGIAGEILNRAIEKKLLVNAIGDNIVRLLPPLIIERDEIDIALETLNDIFS